MMYPINFLNFSKAQRLNSLSFTSNPVKSQNSLQNDTFVYSSNEASKKQAEINSAKRKIEAEKSLIAQKELELIEARESRKKAAEEEKEARKLSEISLDKKYELMASRAYRNYLSKINIIRNLMSTISKAKAHLRNLEEYLLELEANPNIAFLINPDLTKEEKEKILEESETVVNLAQLASRLNIPSKITQGWFKAGCFHGITTTKTLSKSLNGTYIDIEDESNSAFLKEITPKLKTSITGDIFSHDYNTNEVQLRTAFQEGKLKALGFEGVERGIGPYSMMFDLEDETNKKFIENLKKTRPTVSKYYDCVGKKDGLIPISHLQELGFGDIKTLKDLIKSKKVKGVIQKIETPNGTRTRTFMDVSSANRTYVVLTTLRDNNPDTISAKDLIKELHISQPRIKKALLEGELEIIENFLFYDDAKSLYFKRSNPKNADFINKVMFENMLAEELKAQHRQELREKNIQRLEGYNKLQSLKMTLAWSMCPNTRQIASSLAKDDGYLCSLLVKENENEEELSLKEQSKVNSYRKEMWTKAGIEEFKAAIQKAQRYIDLYLKDGLEAIDDEKIKDIFRQYSE